MIKKIFFLSREFVDFFSFLLFLHRPSFRKGRLAGDGHDVLCVVNFGACGGENEVRLLLFFFFASPRRDSRVLGTRWPRGGGRTVAVVRCSYCMYVWRFFFCDGLQRELVL